MADSFIIPKIPCLHLVQVSINTNKKIEQRRRPSFQTISRLTLVHTTIKCSYLKSLMLSRDIVTKYEPTDHQR